MGRFGWFLLRLNSDTTLPHGIPSFHKAVCSAFTFSYSSIEDGKASHQAPTNNKFVQYSMATFILLGAGIMPSTPISDFLDEQMTAMLQSDDYAYYIGLAFIALVTFQNCCGLAPPSQGLELKALCPLCAGNDQANDGRIQEHAGCEPTHRADYRIDTVISRTPFNKAFQYWCSLTSVGNRHTPLRRRR